MTPHLVFLHGFGEDSRIWQDFMPEAFADFVTYQPNYADWVDCSSIAAFARRIVVDLPSTHKYVFIGHSMGGYIALEIANQFPEMTHGVIMLHSTFLADSSDRKNQREKTAKFIQEHGSEIFIRSFVNNLFAQSYVNSQADKIGQLVERYKVLNGQGLVSATMAMKDRADFRTFIEMTPIPFLFILGDQDSLIPLASILEILKGKDQHKYVILEGVAHQGCYESPQETLRAIQSFISEFHD